MRCRTPLIAFVATAAISPLPTLGQDIAPPAPPDSRVRVTMEVPAGRKFVGTLRAWDAESLSLDGPGGPPGRLELSEMAKLEVSRGMQGNARTGFVIGSLVGLAGGFIGAALAGVDDENEQLARVSIAMGSMAVGAALGAVTGALIKTETWQELPIPDGR